MGSLSGADLRFASSQPDVHQLTLRDHGYGLVHRNAPFTRSHLYAPQLTPVSRVQGHEDTQILITTCK